MNQTTLEYAVAHTRELIGAVTCSAETKAAAQAWLNAAETGLDAAQTEAYIRELEADIMPIDTLIGFAESAQGAQVFGAEKAGQVAAHAKEIKAAGAKFCDCPACAAVAKLLEKKADMLR